MKGLARLFALPILVLLAPILLASSLMRRGESRRDARLRAGLGAAGIMPDGLITGDDVQGKRCALGWTISPPAIWSIQEGGEARRGTGEAIFHDPDRSRRLAVVVRAIETAVVEGVSGESGQALIAIRSVTPDERARAALGNGWLARFAIPDPDALGGDLRAITKVSEVLDLPPDEARRALRRGGAIGEPRPALAARILVAQLAEFGIEADLIPV